MLQRYDEKLDSERKFLSGDEKLNTLIRSFDWSETSIGPAESWSQSLRSALSICLNSDFPIAIYWGKDLTLLYNTAWGAIPGKKHPAPLGKPARELLSEIWAELEAELARAFKGQAGRSRDVLLPVIRKGYTAECYFDLTFTPLYGEGGTVEGIFNTATETTYRVINERRASFLNNLANTLTQCTSSIEAYSRVANFIKDSSRDIPFATVYTVACDGSVQFSAGTFDHMAVPGFWKKELPFAEAANLGRSLHVRNLDEYMESTPPGYWSEPSNEGALIPLKSGKGVVHGFLFLGLSPRLEFNDDYRNFMEAVAGCVDTVVQTIFSLELERKKAADLAEIVKAKTAFINIFKGADHVFEFSHPKNNGLYGDADLTGLKLAEALPELRDQGITEVLDQVFKDGITVEQHERLLKFKNSNGIPEDRYLNFIYQPWYDIKNNIQGVLNFAIDVTRQVQAQKLIAKSEQNLRNIIAQAPVPMCIFKGPEFVVETANERMLEFWGKPLAEVLNKPVFEGLPEIKEQGFDALLNDVYTSGQRYAAVETPVTLFRNGVLERVYVNFVYEALRENDGVISGVMAAAIEVTEQVLARKKIEAAEEKARLAIESADLGTYHIDIVKNQITTSERFNLIWDAEPDTPRKELSARIHPNDRELRLEAQRRAFKNGHLEYEVRVLWRDQSIHWIRVNGKILFDAQGEATDILGMIQDITDHKRFAGQLSRQVEERTQQLRRSNEDLQQFAHVASHDLKEPVRKVKIFSGRLAREFGSLLPDRAQTYISKIQQSADRMVSMIEGVMMYSSMNAYEQPTEPVAIERIIDGIREDMEIMIAEKQALISTLGLPVIQGAPVLIYQLFYNLINNSLKFSKKDQPVRISIVASEEVDGTVRIVLSDNGIGFRQESAQAVFETFTRLNAKDEFEGTGLGLSLCRKIVERHQGTIAAQSSLNEGATFIIVLPMTQNQNHL